MIDNAIQEMNDKIKAFEQNENENALHETNENTNIRKQ